jgi:hypothetical protein
MKHGLLVISVLLWGCVLYGAPGMGRLVLFEHSIRWMNESNFPYFLKLPEVQQEIRDGVAARLQQKFQLSEVILPDAPSYRVIDGFGKAKLTWPKTFAPNEQEFALVSAMSRESTSLAIIWNLEISARLNGKVAYAKTISREVVPLSVSGYFTRQRWLEANEFTYLFLKLVDAALDLHEMPEGAISVGSIDLVTNKINQLLSADEHYTLCIDGGMLREMNSDYLLKKDAEIIEHFRYREGADATRVKNSVWNEIVNGLLGDAGLPVALSAKVKEVRMGKLIARDGAVIKFRLSWLGETQPDVLITLSGNAQMNYQIFGEVFDKKSPDALYASYIYFTRVNTNNEELTRKHFRLSGTYGTLGVSLIHFIRGNMNSKDFELIYQEQEGMVLLTIEDKPVAVLSMFNENPASRSFNGQKLSDKKRLSSGGTRINPDASSPAAEWYSLYTTSGVTEESLKDYLQLITMLFFSISQVSAAP